MPGQFSVPICYQMEQNSTPVNEQNTSYLKNLLNKLLDSFWNHISKYYANKIIINNFNTFKCLREESGSLEV